MELDACCFTDAVRMEVTGSSVAKTLVSSSFSGVSAGVGFGVLSLESLSPESLLVVDSLEPGGVAGGGKEAGAYVLSCRSGRPAGSSSEV